MALYVSHTGRVADSPIHPGAGWSVVLRPSQTPDNYDPADGDVFVHHVRSPTGRSFYVPLVPDLKRDSWYTDSPPMTEHQAALFLKENVLKGDIYGVGLDDRGRTVYSERWA